MKAVYIASALRTPMGSFGGSLSSLTATQLGSSAIKASLEAINLSPEAVNEVFMGNVVSANLGQAPARQAALGAGLGINVPCTTVNKVCSSGTKAIMLAAQTIALGMADVIVAGGMESMSNAPFYVPKARFGYKFGSSEFLDGLVKDGLQDAYNHKPMGICGDNVASEMGITREQQDEYAIRSYTLSKEKTENGRLAKEIAPISIPQRKGDPLVIDKDEEFSKVRFEKIPALRPAFTKDGSVTAANASTLNDGASALIIVSEDALKKYNLTPLARIVSFADAAQEPENFPVAPTLAAPVALQRAGVSMNDIDVLEVNEAFSMVPLAFCKKLNVDMNKVNINGGAVSLGHPLGMSGARIVATLAHELNLTDKKRGLAAICNGGGGASAMVIEKA